MNTCSAITLCIQVFSFFVVFNVCEGIISPSVFSAPKAMLTYTDNYVCALNQYPRKCFDRYRFLFFKVVSHPNFSVLLHVIYL